MSGYRWRLKYDPDQPRVPAGNPRGGQWTSSGAMSEMARRGRDRYVRMWGEEVTRESYHVTRDKSGEEVVTIAEVPLHMGSPMVRAYKSGVHVGTMSFTWGRDENERIDKLLLWRMTVEESERRKGIATTMLRHAEKKWGMKVVVDTFSPLTGMGQAFWDSLEDKE